MRTIYELDDQDKLIGVSVSDTLAFCIVASDYLKARRRRFPLYSSFTNDAVNNDTTFYLSSDVGEIRTSTRMALFITNFYPNTLDCAKEPYFGVWNYAVEYIE